MRHTAHLKTVGRTISLILSTLISTAIASAQNEPLSLELSRKSGNTLRLPATPRVANGTSTDLIVRSGTVYIRSLSLTYSAPHGQSETRETQVRQLVTQGDSVTKLALSIGGKPLTSVTVNSDPASLTDGTILELRVDHGNSTQATQSSPQTGFAANTTVGALPKQSGWPLVASLRTTPNTDRHAITIGRDKGPMKNFEITARIGALNITKVRIILAASEAIEMETAGELSASQRPLHIRLDHADTVREIIVISDPRRPNTSPAIIEVRAEPNESWNGAIGENRLKTGGWVLLGTVTISKGMREQTDRANFTIPGAEGNFQRLRLVARRQAVSMLNVTIDSGDGNPQTIPVNATLQPDIQSPLVALPAARIKISRITIQPVIRNRAPIDADIEVWAQY